MPWQSGIYWIALYDNDQPPTDQRTGATYADIDRDKLAAFGLYRNEQPIILVDFRDDSNGDSDIGPKRLIWRMRHKQDSSGQHVTIHLVGWQRKVAGRNVQSICYVNEDGTVILGGQWLEDKPLMHAIVPLECEADLNG
jgi:hypothetical protein